MVRNKLHWDANDAVGQNKGTLTSTARLSFVLKVPLRPSVIYSLPRDRVLQRAYSVREIASEEALNYHSWLWLLLCHIILSQTYSKLRNDSIEDSEVDNRLEKNIDFADHLKNAKSVAGFSPCRQSVSTRTEGRHLNVAWLTSFFKIAATSEVETSVSEKLR